MDKRKKTLSREQAMELYDDLEKAMGHLLTPAERARIQQRPSPQARAQAAYKKPVARMSTGNEFAALQSMIGREKSNMSGKSGAIVLLSVLGILKIATAVIDATGVFDVAPAQASLAPVAQVASIPSQRFSSEEKKLLTSLDERRAQLEERSRKLDQREQEFASRDQDFASRLTELREMTNALKLDREKNDKKRSTQIEQLANVYGSMDPKEAASLIEQLDITISLALLQKMPEKRIAQILALMTPSRALAITKMLSGSEAKGQ